MKNKCFTITAKNKGDKDTQFHVFFVKDWIEPQGQFQIVTTCGIRLNKSIKTYWGSTICNVHDIESTGKGRQWAFRRAFLQLVAASGACVDGDRLNPKTARNDDSKRKTLAAIELFDLLRYKLHEAEAW